MELATLYSLQVAVLKSLCSTKLLEFAGGLTLEWHNHTSVDADLVASINLDDVNTLTGVASWWQLTLGTFTGSTLLLTVSNY